MNLKRIKIMLEVRESEALAYTGILSKKMEEGKISVDKLQESVDNFCDNIARNFILTYKDFIKDEKSLQELRKYICSVGADKPYSGKRVHEALYKKLNNLEKNINDIFSC